MNDINIIVIGLMLLAAVYIFYRLLTSNMITWKSEKDIIRLVGDMRFRLDWAIAAVAGTFILRELVRAWLYSQNTHPPSRVLLITSIVFTVALYWLAGEIHAETRWRKQMDKRSSQITTLESGIRKLDEELKISQMNLDIANENLRQAKENLRIAHARVEEKDASSHDDMVQGE